MVAFLLPVHRVSPSSRYTVAALACAISVAGAAHLLAERPLTQRSTPSPGPFTEAQARRGEALHMENCAQCHRFDLTGGDLAPAVVGPAFTQRWTARPLSDLFDYMRTEMPLNSRGGLSAAQNADSLAFLMKKNGSVAGKVPLPPRSG